MLLQSAPPFLSREGSQGHFTYLMLTVPRSWMIGHIQSRNCTWLQSEFMLTCHTLSCCKLCMLMSGASAMTACMHFLLHTGTIDCSFCVASPVIVHAAGQPMSLGSDMWPQGGHLQFCGVQLKYSREAPHALAGVSFELRPGQKVGICGRTGQLSASAPVAVGNSKSEQGCCMHGQLSFHCIVIASTMQSPAESW